MEQPITEKNFIKMLISSISGILVCMICLVSVTWAWFTVDLDNTDNLIEIGEPKVAVQVDSAGHTSGAGLAAGTHTVSLSHSGNADDFQQKSTLYVTLTVNGTQSAYVVLNATNGYQKEISLELDAWSSFAWEASWFAPDGAQPLQENSFRLVDETQPTVTTEATE